jgi:cell surface protein SprA
MDQNGIGGAVMQLPVALMRLWTTLLAVVLLPIGAWAQADSSSGPNPWNYPGQVQSNGFRTETTFDPATGLYKVQRFMGDVPLGIPEFFTASQYRERMFNLQQTQSWQDRLAQSGRAGGEGREGSSLIPDMFVSNEAFKNIFGSNAVEVRPQGTAELRFGVRYQKIENPMIPLRNQRTWALDFDQRMQVNATGKVGDRLNLQMNYDTEATFAFENKTKLDFRGQEDDIVKSLELGNVSLPMTSSLITGAQSLFGVKGQFQFGKTTVTTLLSEQRSQSQSINIQGGATAQQFEIEADQYEANRHFFLGHYFRDQYENALATLPVINSSVQITRLEVWVTNRRSMTEETRNIVAFMDLGETESRAFRNSAAGRPGLVLFPGQALDAYPSNRTNRLNPEQLVAEVPGVRDISQASSALTGLNLDANQEFSELTNARKLAPNEYRFHPQLGYLTLNTSLNQDEVLAVAYQYTANGRIYQVGEFSNDGINPPKTLLLKLLKGPVLNVQMPLWDLMMKNVYSLNAFQLAQEDFRLDILYRNDATGLPIPFLPQSSIKNELLVQALGTDKVNNNGDPFPDGIFDYVEGITVHAQTGRIIFPVLEPFGSALAAKLTTPAEKKRYVFQQLYDSTRFRAQAETQLNKFVIKGRYKSAGGSVIQLNAFNIPRGSISVTAGGTKLTENQDFTVDYALGQVRILNEALLSSGVPIRVSFENNTLFNFQTKTFVGTTFEHKFSPNLTVGGALLNMRERSLTQKVNAGEEPINNTIWGLNTQFQKNLPQLTKLLDKLPLISTKESSSLQFQGEVAQLLPGTPRSIKLTGSATTYIDDFEGAQTLIDLRGNNTWTLASVPDGQSRLFPEASYNNSVTYGSNRARTSWYIIDPTFFANTAATPQNIRQDPSILSDHRQRMIPINEVFPNLPVQPGMARNIAMFDVSFFPGERGPYNYDVEGFPGLSKGLDAQGRLNDPKSRWGGLMRSLQINNFEEQNIEFIQFWVMDPFYGDPTATGGDLYFHLGNLSEDILKDGRQSFENGLSPLGLRDDLDSSAWGYTSRYQPITEAFGTDPIARTFQDLGLDGLSDADELRWRTDLANSYVERLTALYGSTSTVVQQALADPAGDNFRYFRGDDLDNEGANILDRYKKLNSPQGNSNTETVNGVPASATNMPDKEDINRDQTMNKSEAYFQYKVSLRPEDIAVGKNNIADIFETTTDELPDQTRKPVRWIQFKIPVFEPEARVGGISDFRSIRFLRMVLKGWDSSVVLRFARLDLVRGEWRRYPFSLDGLREEVPTDQGSGTTFAVNAVNLEENGGKTPIPYVLPPGIDRQILLASTAPVPQNEQAISMRICGLRDGDARAVFKNMSVDMRWYKRLRLFVHAEAAGAESQLRDDDLSIFIRLGNDYSQNYYEYELPLKVTPWGIRDPDAIWPDANHVDLPLEALTQLKLERDRLMQIDPSWLLTNPYVKDSAGAIFRVVGVPNLGLVRTVLIGVRNAKKRESGGSDDGYDKCAEVWINEFRMADFENQGGEAATARASVKLADLGQVVATGLYSGVGFGAIDQGPTERNRFASASYDVQGNLEVGKVLGSQRLKLPLFVSMAQEFKTPQYNPLNPDIKVDDAVKNLPDAASRDSLRTLVQDLTQRRSVALTNVRVDRSQAAMKKNPTPLDLSNWNATYSFNEVLRRDANIQFDNRQDYRGALAYVYQAKPFNLRPFKKITNKNLALIRDINLNLTPSRFSARTDVQRTLQLLQMRNVDNPQFKLPVTYNKNFTMERTYDLVWDLSQAIKFDYNARMRLRFDERPGPMQVDTVQLFLLDNLRSGGRPTNYHHTANIGWQLPINKIPYLEFIQLQARYTAEYDWQTNSLLASIKKIDSLDYGFMLQNSGKWALTGNLNFNTFYNKFPFLKKYTTSTNRGNAALGGRGMPASPKPTEEQPKETKKGPLFYVLKTGVGFLTMAKTANLSYTRNTGSSLPGFNLAPVLFGGNVTQNWAPGWDYLLGWQFPIEERAASNNWMVKNRNQPNRLQRTLTENINVRAQVEPLPEFRIDLTAQRTFGDQYSSTYRYSTGRGPDTAFGQGFRHFSPQQLQNFTMSWWAFNSAFENSPEPEFKSVVYDLFRANRLVFSDRLAAQHALDNPGYLPTYISDPDSSRYGYDGFSVIQQDVLVRSFLSAYGGDPAATASLGAITSGLPRPNWKVNYTGLQNIEWVKRNFTSVALSHGYTGNLTATGIQTNMLRAQKLEDNPLNPFPRNDNNDVLPELQIGQISMSENFSPLVGVQVRTKSNATFKMDINRSRQIALSLANNQFNETKSRDLTLGVGYIIPDVKFTVVDQAGGRTQVKSNLELKLDVRFNDNQTVIRKILEDFVQPTAGQRRTTIKFTADYRLSRRLTAQAYYDQSASRFKTGNAFPTAQVQAGFAFKLNLGG